MTQVKGFGSYRIPIVDLQASASFSSTPGPSISANYNATNGDISPTLGRNLSGNAANVTVANIIAPLTQYEKRIQQFDVRLIKNFRIQQMRLQGTFDVYNVFNRADVLSEVTQYGATWRNPTSLLDARIFKVGVQMTF